MSERLKAQGEFCPWPRKPNRRERALRNRERRAAGLPVGPALTPPKVRPPDRVPTHGTVPSEAEGWVADKAPSDPELFIARITVVRFDDYSTQRFYLMRVRPEVVKAKRALLRKKLKAIDRRLKEAERREAKAQKHRVRALLAVLGR
jgi:hypothetical protein